MGCTQSVEAAVGAVYDVSGSDVSDSVVSVVDVSVVDVSVVDVSGSVAAALENLKEPTQPITPSPPVTPPQGSVSPDPEPSTPAPLQTAGLL